MTKFLILSLTLLSLCAHAEEPTWPPGKSCAAWAAHKKLLFFKSENPVGINCSIQTKMTKSPEGLFLVQVTIPLNKFDSQEPERDKDVADYFLKSSLQPDLEFVSAPMKVADWAEILQQKKGSLKGDLKIAKIPYPITLTLSLDGNLEKFTLKGFYQGSFSQFNVERPKMLGGAAINTLDPLELYFKVESADIVGLAEFMKEMKVR